jgi:hypothetical protein
VLDCGHRARIDFDFRAQDALDQSDHREAP